MFVCISIKLFPFLLKLLMCACWSKWVLRWAYLSIRPFITWFLWMNSQCYFHCWEQIWTNLIHLLSRSKFQGKAQFWYNNMIIVLERISSWWVYYINPSAVVLYISLELKLPKAYQKFLSATKQLYERAVCHRHLLYNVCGVVSSWNF